MYCDGLFFTLLHNKHVFMRIAHFYDSVHGLKFQYFFIKWPYFFEQGKIWPHFSYCVKASGEIKKYILPLV